MSDSVIAPARQPDLRGRAAAQLGLPAAAGAPVTPAEALAVLHALASSPATAADALALLHELQVHQVELDMQAQELRESRVDLEAALRRQTDRHEALPVACLRLDRQWLIRETNPAGARLLGVDRDAARGLRLDAFFSAADMDQLQTLAALAAQGQPDASATLPARPRAGPPRWLLAHLAADPAGDGHLLVLAGLDAAAPRP